MFSAITVFPILAFAVTVYLMKENRSIFGRYFVSIIVAFITVLVTMVLGLIVRGMAPMSLMAEYDNVRIVALSASSSIESSFFFLGSGRIEGRPSYFFYFETPSGGKKLAKLYADDVTGHSR